MTVAKPGRNNTGKPLLQVDNCMHILSDQPEVFLVAQSGMKDFGCVSAVKDKVAVIIPLEHTEFQEVVG